MTNATGPNRLEARLRRARHIAHASKLRGGPAVCVCDRCGVLDLPAVVRNKAIAVGAGGWLDTYRGGGRVDVAFRLQENRWNGTVSPQLVVRRIYAAELRFEELRDWLVAEYRKPADARDPEATAIFAELEIESAGLGRRHLLESERFRALLAGEPALAKAA